MESNSKHTEENHDEHSPETLTPPPSPPWIDLPRDVTANILHRLGAIEILESAQKVCTTWWRICLDPAMWRVIHLTSTGDMGDRILTVCRLAVNRSQGQLIDLRIDYIGDVELLNYVVERSSHLKRLSLNRCLKMRGLLLSLSLENLPQLEELHIAIMPSVKPEAVKYICNNCHKLKSFTLCWCPDYDLVARQKHEHDCVIVITRAMYDLQLLGQLANWIEDWRILLNGRPHLESLDLRVCPSLERGCGCLGKRCREQVKVLKLPSKPITGVEWNPCLRYDYKYFDIIYAYWFRYYCRYIKR